MKEKTAEQYFNSGIKKHKAGQFEVAIAEFDSAIEINPEDSEVYYNRGTAKSKLKQFQAAIVDFDKAIELNSKYSEAYVNLGVTKMELGKLQDAIVDFDSAIKLNREFSEAYSNRGLAKVRLSKFREAIVDFNRAIKLNPKYSEAYCNCGFTLAKLGQFKEAIANFNKAIELKPDFALAYYGRGNCHRKLGDEKLALEDFRKANDLDPTLIPKKEAEELEKKVAETRNFQKILEDNQSEYIKIRNSWEQRSKYCTIVVLVFLIIEATSIIPNILKVWDIKTVSLYGTISLKVFVITINFLFIRLYLNADKMVIISGERLVASKLLENIKAGKDEEDAKIKELSYPQLLDIICGGDSKQKDKSFNINLAEQVYDKLSNKINPIK